MKKSPSLLTSLVLFPTLAAALTVVSCGGGESPSNSNGTGGSASSGGKSGSNSGGSSGFSSGGSTGSGTGGSTTSGSGGSSSSGSGGSTSSGSGGTPTFGSGGSTSSGTGGAIVGAGTGGAPSTGGALTVVDGYAMGGTWKGYAYSFTGPATGSKATVTPATFKAMTTLCIDGSIMADTTYTSVAGMGWNINQALGTTATEPPIEAVAVSGSGLTVNVTSTGLTAGQLRAQIKGTTGDYCATIGITGSTTIPWAMFNSKCWDGSGTKFADTSIKAVEFVIPSAAAAIGPFHLCLLDAHP